MISKAAIPAFHALLVRQLTDSRFDPHWHFHPEYQLFTVLQGTGTRFVGDSVQRFGPGDLVLTGPNLPHVWRSDDAYFEKDSRRRTDGIVVYFREVILGEKLLSTQEGLKIQQLLKRTEQGLAFYGETQQDVTRKLEHLVRMEGFDSILGLLHILHTLSLSEEYEVLSRLGFVNQLSPTDQERMEQVYSYVMERFTEPIRLEKVAAVASMTETAFCRYFKERANKTLSQFIAELRIGYACKLLVEESLNISQIAYESGYPTLSNFNQQFKAISGLTPRQYRQKYAAVHVEADALAGD